MRAADRCDREVRTTEELARMMRAGRDPQAKDLCAHEVTFSKMFCNDRLSLRMECTATSLPKSKPVHAA